MSLSVPLSQSVVVITGASSGLGAAVARRLARHGTRMALAARGREPLEKTAQACRALGAEAIAVPTDIAEPAAVEALAHAAELEFGHIDAWINNAAVSEFGRLLDMPLDEVRRVIDVDLFGYLNGVRAAVPRLRAAGGGVVIMVDSILSETHVPYQGPYIMAKHGLLGMSGTLRQELRADDGPPVSICDVIPSSIDTPLYLNAGNRTGRRLRPLRPVNSPARLARGVVRLLAQPRQRLYVGVGSRSLSVVNRIAPQTTESLLGWWARRTQFANTRQAADDGNLREPGAVSGHVSGGWNALVGSASALLRTTVRRSGF